MNAMMVKKGTQNALAECNGNKSKTKKNKSNETKQNNASYNWLMHVVFVRCKELKEALQQQTQLNCENNELKFNCSKQKIEKEQENLFDAEIVAAATASFQIAFATWNANWFVCR